MITYDRLDQHDILLAQWWALMRQTEEFELTFSNSLAPLGAFMAFWRGSTVLVFDTDEQGITVAVWFQPVMSESAAFAGLWVRKDKRRLPGIYRQVEQAYDAALNHWAVLIGVTRRKELLRPHKRLGYQVMGQLPGIWDGDTAWIVFLTRGGWDGRWVPRHRKGRARAGQEPHGPDDPEVRGGVRDGLPADAGAGLRAD